jgi:aspartokinase-like uncharacterized kinase
VTPLVVKIGGSLAESGRLGEALHLIGRAERPVVVVPGGGPFADAVRGAQEKLGFSDAAAHRMALLAMHQMALLMTALHPRLAAAETLSAMRAALREKRVPVWLPAKLVERDRDIPADWSITSDGLAAWLAERLGCAPLVLLKSCRVSPDVTAAALARDGVVDPVFAAIVARAGLDWRLIGPGEEGELAALLKVRDARTLPSGAAKNYLGPASRPRLGCKS